MSRRISSFIPVLVAPLTLVCSPGYAEDIHVTPSNEAQAGTAAHYQRLSASLQAVPNQQKSSQSEPLLSIDEQGRLISGKPALVVVKNAAGETVGSGIVKEDGTELTVTFTDATGNLSLPATVTATVVDTTPPDAPDNVVISADGSIITGTGEPGTTVEIRASNGGLITSDTVDNNGYFSVTLTPALRNGEKVDVVLVDAAGNESTPVSVQAEDTTAPDTPKNLQVNATGTLLSGTGEIGTSVTVRNVANQMVGTSIVQPDGTFAVKLDPVQGDRGLLSVTLTDGAGNKSVAGTVNAPDLIPPAMPEDLALNTTGNTLTGTGEKGAKVTVRNVTNHVVGRGTVQPDGSFSIALNPPQIDGRELQVTLEDASGNISAPRVISAPYLIEIASPRDLQISADGRTLTGTGDAETFVTVWNADGQQVGNGLVAANGSFIVVLNQEQVDGKLLQVVLSDGAGKYSAPSMVQTPDLMAPSIPANLQVNATGTVLTGTGEAGTTVRVLKAASGVWVGGGLAYRLMVVSALF